MKEQFKPIHSVEVQNFCSDPSSGKWACQACTDQSRQDNSDTSCGDKKATVYSPASKQLLIFCPPAILTLHLKVRISSV